MWGYSMKPHIQIRHIPPFKMLEFCAVIIVVALAKAPIKAAFTSNRSFWATTMNQQYARPLRIRFFVIGDVFVGIPVHPSRNTCS